MGSISRLLTSCGDVKWDRGREEFHLSIGTFLRQLFLFDEIILQSVRLKEFGPLIDIFGFGPVMGLLDSGAIRLRCEALVMAEVGRNTALGLRKGEPPLPLNQYSFTLVWSPNRKEYLVGCLPSLQGLTTITTAQKNSLMAKVLSLIEDPIDAIGPEMLNQTKSDLRNNTGSIKFAVAEILRITRDVDFQLSGLAVRIEEIKEGVFRAETNLCQKLGVSPEEEHRIVQGALLSIGGLNRRIAEMKAYEALPGFSMRDIPLFDEKLRFLIRQCPDVTEKNFVRILDTLSLPDFESAATRREIDLNRILKIRDSQECRGFRLWLATAEAVSTEDLKKAIRGLRTKIGEVISGTTGQVCRFLIAGGVGIPCWPAGLAIASLDKFLLERLFPRNRVAGFLDKLYPSVFRNAEDRKN